VQKYNGPLLHRAAIIISKQQNDTDYTPKSQTSNLRNVHRVIMTIISPNDCLTPLIPGSDDPYGLVMADKLPVTYR